jgi:hypothetical protein
MSLRVLVVDGNAANLAAVRTAIGPLAEVDAVSDFRRARELLLSSRYDRLIANLRLGAYNGLHLVHLADAGTRSIVYTDQPEAWCAREVQAAGAFYEYRLRLQDAIAGYLADTLPAADRRKSSAIEPRNAPLEFRRRASDAVITPSFDTVTAPPSNWVF